MLRVVSGGERGMMSLGYKYWYAGLGVRSTSSTQREYFGHSNLSHQEQAQIKC
jgi:hypothetical protein